MANHPCIGLAQAAAVKAGHPITEAQANKILLNHARLAAGAIKAGVASNAVDAARMAAEMLVGEHLYARTVAVKATLATIKAGRIVDASRDAAMNAGHLAGDGLRAPMVGSSKKFSGSRVSMDSIEDSTYKRLAGFLSVSLDKLGLFDYFKDPKNARKNHEAGWNLSQINPAAGSVTGDAKALAVAQVRKELNRMQAGEINAAGGYLRETPGYVGMQTHAREKLVGLGRGKGEPVNYEKDFQAWKALVMPLVDEFRSYKGADPNTWLREFHNNIYTGDFDSAAQSGSPSKTGGVIGKLAAERKMIFKDAGSAWKYNELLGEKDLYHGTLSDMQRTARSSASIQMLGGDPVGVINAAYGRAAEKIKNTDTILNKDEHMRSLQSWKTDAAVSLTSGRADVSGDPRVARLQANAQGVVAASINGGIILSALAGDPVFMGVWGSSRGTGTLNLMSKAIRNYLGGLPKDLGRALKLVGFGNEGFAKTAEARFAQYDRSSRGLAWFNSKISEITTLDHWTESSKEAVAEVITGMMGLDKDKPFDATHPRVQRLLWDYGISASEWDALRHGAVNLDGNHFVLGSELESLPQAMKDSLKKDSGLSWEATKQKLSSKFNSLLHSESNTAVLTPGMNERMYTSLGGTQAGSPAGIVARNLMMYKGYAVTTLTKVWGNEIHGNGYKGMLFGEKGIAGTDTWIRNNKLRLAGIVAGGLVSGYLNKSIRDTIAGKEPESWTTEDGEFNFRLFKESMQRGGVGGLYGDLILNQYERGFRDVSSYAAGPTWSKVIDPAGMLVSNMLQGKFDQARTEAVSAAAGLVPNIVFARQALDRAILWSLQEWANPGYLERMERNTQNKTGQDYWLSPDVRLK